MAQNAARQRAGLLAALVDDNCAIDDHRRDTDRILMGRGIGRGVGDRRGIPDGDVRPIASTQETALREIQARGG